MKQGPDLCKCWDNTIEKIHTEIDQRAVVRAIETFGENVYVTSGEEEGKCHVVFRANLNDAYLWALANGDAVTVTKPQCLNDKIHMVSYLAQLRYHKYRVDNVPIRRQIEDSDILRLHMSHPTTCQYVAVQGALDKVGEIFIDTYNEKISEQIKHYVNVEKITVLPLSDIPADDKMKDLSSIAKLKNLKILYISREELTDASGISDLPFLETLDIQYTGISDIGFIRSLPSLKSLDISGKYITDFSPLYEVTGLVTLYVDDLAEEHIDMERLYKANPNIHVV